MYKTISMVDSLAALFAGKPGQLPAFAKAFQDWEQIRSIVGKISMAGGVIERTVVLDLRDTPLYLPDQCVIDSIRVSFFDSALVKISYQRDSKTLVEGVYHGVIASSSPLVKMLATAYEALPGNRFEIVPSPEMTIVPKFDTVDTGDGIDWCSLMGGSEARNSYPSIHGALAVVLNSILSWFGENTDPITVLELGAGDGTFGLKFAAEATRPLNLTLIDGEPKMIDRAIQRQAQTQTPEGAQVTILPATDLTRVRPVFDDGSFSIIYACGFLNIQVLNKHEADTVLNWAISKLKPGGYIVLTGMTDLFTNRAELEQTYGLMVISCVLPGASNNRTAGHQFLQLYVAQKPA